MATVDDGIDSFNLSTSFDEEVLVDMDACFAAFDKNGDGKLDIDEFRLICKALFRNDRGKIYTLEESKVADIFQVFDQNSDGFIGMSF